MCNDLRSRISIGMVWCLAAAFPALADVASSEPSWRTVAASGTVEARTALDSQTNWQRVGRGDQLPSRSAVRTGRSGRATLTRDSHILIVDPDTQLQLPVVSGRAGSSVSQTSGTVIYQVDGTKTRDFKVVTPYLVAGVKGTVFQVEVTERGASVRVQKGVVEVLSPKTGERLEVNAGETVFADVEASRGMQRVSMEDSRGDRVASQVRQARRAVRRADKDAGPDRESDRGQGRLRDRAVVPSGAAEAGVGPDADGEEGLGGNTVAGDMDDMEDIDDDLDEVVGVVVGGILPGSEPDPEDDPTRNEQDYDDDQGKEEDDPANVLPPLPDPGIDPSTNPIDPDPLGQLKGLPFQRSGD